MTGREVILPNNWQARPYQKPLWNYLRNGGKRAVAVWHRRAGKDDLCLHWTAIAAMKRPGNYWHMLPEASQARKVIWDAVNPHGGLLRIDEAFPKAIRSKTLENPMKIDFINGSTWQVVGSDNYDSLVGATPVGIVFSEWALADPAAWSYLRPVLRENGGWALFIFTPRGRNHAAAFYEAAVGDPEWFGERLSAEQTGVFTKEELAQELAEYIRESDKQTGTSRFRQEYLCDFTVAVVGSYYGPTINDLERDKRVCSVPWEPRVPVWTAWDLGAINMAIWFCQQVGNEVRLIDFIGEGSKPLSWYAGEIMERKQRGWAFAAHLLPHDAKVRELGTGKTRVEQLAELGLTATVLPQGGPGIVEDGISAARALLPRCWFDKTKCEDGLEALRQYRAEWDDEKKVFSTTPRHDWASHPADAFRYLAMGLKPDRKPVKLDYRNLRVS